METDIVLNMDSPNGTAVKSSKSTKMTTRNKKMSKYKTCSRPETKPKSLATSSHTPIPTQPSPSPPSTDIANDPMFNVAQVKPVSERTKTTEINDICKYPLKLRYLRPKKAVHKHQYNFKDKKTNKRKSTVPQKGQQIDYKDPDRVEFTELTMFEIIRFFDETDILDDETIEEIVDCPSPVWWEDAPNDQYCEEPIDRDLVKEALEGNRESPPPIEEDVQIRVQLLKKELKINEKFIKKNNKLENVLGNLKNRITKVKVEDATRDKIMNNNAQNDEIVDNDCHDDTAAMKKENISDRHSESSDGDILSDIGVNEDELLKNLEAIEIPIKDTLVNKTVKKDKKTKAITAPKTMPPLLKYPYQSANAEFSRLITLTESLRSESCTVTSSSDISETSTSKSFAEASTSKTGTFSSNFVDLSKSKSYESLKLSFSDDTMSGDIDSISDTNVRFLDDDDVEMLTCRDADNVEINDNLIDDTVIMTDYQGDLVTKDKETSDVNTFDEVTVSKKSSEIGSSSEESDLVTVYSIVESEPETKEPGVKRVRKPKNNIHKSRDARMIAFLKHNLLLKKRSNKSERTIDKLNRGKIQHRHVITDYIRMPKSVAN